MNPCIWNLPALFNTPETYAAPDFNEPGATALFYETLPWQGRPTRSFAFVGLPDVPEGTRVPGVVLVHGGGGTAFAEWVRLWTERGYAAISMNTCGALPGGDKDTRPRHDLGGPPGWSGCFEQAEWEPTDQWIYHAGADIILAHSLLRSMPQVDDSRIGLTGVSWGGYLTALVAGLDHRFSWAAPVYGCGFMEVNEFFGPMLPDAPTVREQWLKLWDPAQYLPNAKLPMLWVNGTNDFAFPMNAHQMSYLLPRGERTLAIRPRMEHSQPAGSECAEIAAFAEQHSRGASPLAHAARQDQDGQNALASFQTTVPLRSAELLYTVDSGRWTERYWHSQPAGLEGECASTTLPPETTAYFFNVTDERGLLSSSEMTELPPANQR